MDETDRQLLQDVQTGLLDLLQALATKKRPEDTLTNALFQKLGVVTWWLMRADQPMPAQNRRLLMEDLQQLREAHLASQSPPRPARKPGRVVN